MPNRLISWLTPIVLLPALTMCGCGGAKAKPERSGTAVASITSPSPSGKSTASNEDTEGIQLRLDTTQAERDAIVQAYLACLKQHGWKGAKDTAGSPMSKLADIPECNAKRPIAPRETDPKVNPNYHQQKHDWIRCLREHGIMWHETADGATSDEGYHESQTPDFDRIYRDCQIKSFHT